MTNELEKTFFDTFGIEPEEEKYCLWECKEPSLEHVPCNKECKYQRHDIYYPQITDRILLELICLCPDLDNVFFTDVEKLKETLLNSYINIYNYYVNAESLSDCEKELKHQVRTLFEEG